MRFGLAWDLSDAWCEFGFMGAQFAHFGALRDISVGENATTTIANDRALRTTISTNSRRRAVKGGMGSSYR